MKLLLWTHLFVGTLLLVTNCYSKREAPLPDDGLCKDYALGVLSIGLKDTASLEEILDYTNQNKVLVSAIYMCSYTCSLPSDSMDYLVTQLNSKPYINHHGWEIVNDSTFIDNQTSQPSISFPLFDMDSVSQQDWVKSCKSLKLTESITPYPHKVILLQVPNGEEKNYLHLFSRDPKIKWAELDCINQRQPM